MDATQIDTLCVDLGPHAAEDVICRAMEELAQRLCSIQDMAAQGPRENLPKALRALGAIARQIGMSGLSNVAHDVINCVEWGDVVAEAATLARLARCGERSLSSMWEHNDLMG